MAKDLDKSPQEEASGFVAVLIARSVKRAEQFCELLDDHDIPAIIGAGGELAELEDAGNVSAGPDDVSRGVPVLVPESMLDEASQIIADREDFGNVVEGELEEEEDEDDEFGLTQETDEKPVETLDDEDDDDDFLDDDEDLDDCDDGPV